MVVALMLLLAAPDACGAGTLLNPRLDRCVHVEDRRAEFAAASGNAGRLPDLRVLRGTLHGGPVRAPLGDLASGVAFRYGHLRVENEATLYTRMIVRPGGVGNLSNWLYTTATNRTERTVEVVGMYHGPTVAQLGIFDWSCSPADPCGAQTSPSWQVCWPLSQLACNYGLHPDGGGHDVPLMYYANGTRRDGQGRWHNEVFLWNECLDQWDLVYSHSFGGSQRDCSALNQVCGWWGPILESFVGQPNPVMPELGFLDGELRYDGKTSLLLPEDVEFFTPQTTWSVLHGTPYGSWTVGVGASQLQSVQFTAGQGASAEAAASATATVRLTTWGGPSSQTLLANYSTANGNALAGSDYTALSGVLTFPADSADGATATLVVPLTNDAAVEANETFSLSLSQPQGGSVGPVGSHQVTILDDDGTVRLTAAAASVPEGGGSVTLTAQLSTSNAANTSNPITFDYAAATGVGQTAGSRDYTPVSGAFTFPPGSAHNTTRLVTVPILQNAAIECPETFSVTLSNVLGGALGPPASAEVTILDDDLAAVGVGIVGVTEGNSGTTPATFQVTLSPPPCGPATVSYATQNESAVSNGTYPDYVATAGTLTFHPPVVTLPVNVPVVGDSVHEDFQQFRLQLSNPVNAMGTPTGWGNITDNDAAPTVSVGPGLLATNETDEGTAPYPFQVSVSGNLSEPGSTVNFNTAKGTANGGTDFVATSGSVTFPPLSQAVQTFTVPVRGDSLDEPEEDFFVELATPGHATVGVGTARAVIWDNDPPAVSSVEVVPGAVVERDMSLGAVHWYRLGQKPYSSYEAVTDGTTGNGTGYYELGRYHGNELQPIHPGSVPVGANFSRSLRWQHNLHPGPAAGATNQLLKVELAGCGGGCQAGRYRLRIFDTTYAVSRFNNAAGQVTALSVQNTSSDAVSGTAYFWSEAGTLLASSPFVAGQRSAFVLNTATVPALVGQSGSITITHNGRYGALTGKGITVDPVAGFTFDTLMEPRK
jgi:hypothetical protein